MANGLHLVGASFSLLLATFLAVNRRGVGNGYLFAYVAIVFYLFLREWGRGVLGPGAEWLEYLRSVFFLLPVFMWAYIRRSVGMHLGEYFWLSVVGLLAIVSILDFYFIQYLGVSGLVPIMDFTVILMAIAFCYLSLREVRKIQSELQNVASEIHDLRIAWLKIFIFSNLLLCAPFLLDEILHSLGFSTTSSGLYVLLPVLFWFFIVTARHPSLFSNDEIKNLAAVRDLKPTLLDEKKTDELRTCLIDLLRKDPIFLDPEVNISKLAKKLGFGVKEISQFLNSVEKCSFSDYINTKRLEYAVEQMKNRDSRKSILEIAFESGFNSKASFYRQFKKQIKMSPHEFLKSLEV